ncbi:MAG: hypothetical protein HYU77_13125 [Betaproteobacteria bacterium]|nr:hypothetical protein [Betaproteobacteria bacterium]
MSGEPVQRLCSGIDTLAPEACERILEMHLALMREQRRKEIENLKEAARALLARDDLQRKSAAVQPFPGKDANP